MSAASVSGVRAYTSDPNANTVAVIDAGAAVVLGEFQSSQTDVLVASPDGTRLYHDGFDAVGVVRTADNFRYPSIPVGNPVHSIAISSDGSRLYVGVRLEPVAGGPTPGQIVVIDTASQTIVATIDTLVAPERLAVNPTLHRLYGTYGAWGGMVVVDTASNAIVDTVSIGLTPRALAVSPDGSRVYVARFHGSGVAVVDAATNALVSIIPVGGTPWDLAIRPDGDVLYVAKTADDAIALIDTASNTVTGAISLRLPGVMSFHPDGVHLYVAGQTVPDSYAVRVVDTVTSAVEDTIPLPGFSYTADLVLLSGVFSKCGDTVQDLGEECDDGNTAWDDCCSEYCRFMGTGEPCVDDGLPCTADTCNGTGVCAHAAGNAGAVCRAIAGTCDVAETCTGSSPACPPDAKSVAVCRPSAAPCDAAESCDGVSDACPPNALSPSGTVCRVAAGTCDVVETCSGTSSTCPPDTHAGAGVPCRAAAGPCDVAEQCTGTSAACPANGLASVGTACRPAAGECDAAEACTGASPACPADQPRLNGSPCTSDGDACTPDVCTAGACTHADTDADGVGDLCDNCRTAHNTDQQNSDCQDAAYFASGACAANPPVQRAGCCDGGDVCDACPAQRDHESCDPAGSAGAVLGTAGGSLETPDGTIQLQVPAGALPGNTTISVTGNIPGGSFTLERGTTSVMSVALRPENANFGAPVTVTFHWSDRDGDGVVDRGTCVGGGDAGLSCDGDGDCAASDCTINGGPDEATLVLKRNGNKFGAAGFQTGVYRCDEHASGACATAVANCSVPAGTGTATVARCCNRLTNSWSFQTCDFSEYFLGLNAGDLVPGKGSPTTDCYGEWGVHNPLNRPWLDKKGIPNFKQRCADGDPTCDLDGSVNGVCAMDLAVCMNVNDARLVDPGTGAPGCVPSGIDTWQLSKPVPGSVKPFESTNATALRDAVAALATSTIGGRRQEVVSFQTTLAASDLCTAPARVQVPLKKPGKAGQAVLVMQLVSGGIKDLDKLILRCDPPGT